MATALQLLYMKARASTGRGHRAALEEVARHTGLDAGTVGRGLQRARRADERDEKSRGRGS